MSPEAQRIAIATICGYTDIRNEEREHVDIDAREISTWTALYGTKGGERRVIPFYAGSLDAMHGAEDSLDGYMMLKYTDCLLALTGGAAGSFSHIHADAPTRARTFLETFGQWEEGAE